MAELGREQHPVLPFRQNVVEMQQGRRPQNDGGSEKACGAHKQCAQSGDDTIRGAQVGSALAAAIEDQHLMPDEQVFGNDGTDTSRASQPDHGDDQMNKKDDNLAHLGMVSKPQDPPNCRPLSNSPPTGTIPGEARVDSVYTTR